MRYAALALLLSLCTSGYADSHRYVIDGDHLTLGFLVGHIGFAKVFGSFQDATGEFSFDEESGRMSDVRVVVKTASVFTGVEARDRHLRSEDFFDVGTFPEMIFESSGGLVESGKGELPGSLSIRGIRRPVTLAVTWNKSGESPLPGNPYVAGFSARGRFLRSEFGMTYGVADGLVGDEIELLIELEAHRQ